MDAVKFIEECRRMYRVTGKHAPTLDEWTPVEDVVKEVEEWSAAHPRKTRQSVFLEQYPNCMTDDDGVVETCPRNVDKTYVCDLRRLGGCADCRREFWGQEVE
jgi:hypothetical protein